MGSSRFSFIDGIARRVVGYLSALTTPVRDYMQSEMEYEPRGWQPDDAWDEQAIADAQEGHWPTLVRHLQGPGPLGISHLPWRTTREDRADHNIMMSYGYVLALASRMKSSLSILDWGGGAGHYQLYGQALFPDLTLDYHCFDRANLCRLGQSLSPDIRFSSDEHALLDRTYDLVMSSSALHYFEDWRDQVRKLVTATAGYLYVTRLQTVANAPTFVVRHRVLRPGYKQFLSWCINRDELVSCVREHGLELVREFVFSERWVIRGGPEKGQVRGFLFRPAPEDADQ